MARPKLGDSETERLHLKITADEIKAIDDWRYANRVPSRSEAVRRLCQIGIDTHEEIEEAVEHARHLRDGAHSEWRDNFDILQEQKDGPDVEFYSELLHRSHDIYERADRLHTLLVAANNRIVPLLDGKTFKEAVEGSKEARKTSKEIFRQINRQDRERAENLIISRISQSETPKQRAEYEALSDEEQEAWWEQRFTEELGPYTEEDES